MKFSFTRSQCKFSRIIIQLKINAWKIFTACKKIVYKKDESQKSGIKEIGTEQNHDKSHAIKFQHFYYVDTYIFCGCTIIVQQRETARCQLYVLENVARGTGIMIVKIIIIIFNHKMFTILFLHCSVLLFLIPFHSHYNNFNSFSLNAKKLKQWNDMHSLLLHITIVRRISFLWSEEIAFVQIRSKNTRM